MTLSLHFHVCAVGGAVGPSGVVAFGQTITINEEEAAGLWYIIQLYLLFKLKARQLSVCKEICLVF